jgi:hypothetical protein
MKTGADIHLWIISGEGEGSGHRERYDGALTAVALDARVKHESCGGARWCFVEVETATRHPDRTTIVELIEAGIVERYPKSLNRLIPIRRESTKSGMRNVYETPDGRFRVQWHDRQGARSGWSVADLEDVNRPSLRSDSLNEVAETIDEMRNGGSR